MVVILVMNRRDDTIGTARGLADFSARLAEFSKHSPFF
jgi:hypothetical protein